MPDKEQSPSVTELKACPFCREAWVKVRSENAACFSAECQQCAAVGPEADTHDGAIVAWNTRPGGIEALLAEREKLRAIISRAERIIQAERDVLVECHSCPPNKDATDYDPDIREDVEEMDVVLRDARAALNASPKDSPDAP